MSQKNVGNNNQKPSQKHEDEDEGTKNTELPSNTITYSRNTGTFSTNDDEDPQSMQDLYGDDLDDEDLKYDLEHNVHGLPRRRHNNNKNTRNGAAQEHQVSSQLSQWTYNNNRSKLNESIIKLRNLLQQINEENTNRPVQVDITQELQVLQINLRMDGHYNNKSNGKNDFQLDNDAMAILLHNQIEKAIEHLASLKRRVDDVSSKVFITGDLNTGKSSFCNNLLRRQLLPEDQLPCTNVFCEILEARENEGLEEVHAIPNNLASTVKECADKYDIRNHMTYEIHTLNELDELVTQNDKYALLKIYIKDDKRTPEKSLLRNGTVDISLIDSPGLNMDSVQTSEVMARQEEIDLVIFVVNAENQLTLSAKEFIALASREKKLMFFVVKKFDRIKDKERCKRLILEQIKDLSPETYKRAREFVHFISEPESEISPPNPDDNGDSDDSDNDDINIDPDFENLENSLRNFVLKRRSQSKLLPAKTYLCKVLSDIAQISDNNLQIYRNEENKIKEELVSLTDDVDRVKRHYRGVTQSIDKLSEETVTEIYDFTKNHIMNCLSIDCQDIPQYPGISRLYDFVFQTEHYFKDQIKTSIVASELHARHTTKVIVEQIYLTGRDELGDEFMSNRVFDVGLMFSQTTHQLSKNFSVPLTFSDLYAPSWDGLIEYLSWALFSPMKISWHKKPAEIEKPTATDSNKSITTAGSVLGLGNYPLTQYWKRPSLLFTSKLPALAIYSFGGSKIVTTVIFNGLSAFSWKSLGQIAGSVVFAGSLLGMAYIIYDIPRALPQNLLIKYKQHLTEMDYIHTNARRISNEVHDVLKTPTREIVKTCELEVDKKQGKKHDLERKQENNRISIKFFDQILQKATSERNIVNNINLEVD
ncbi:similar to Saccharomyces cerevisiae YBR179C FZO1 Mitofusin [Maudiozyma saulgeensis]|uniref:Similar to Saccharomyces cerevisiae YBR179C FZO1 Mitofusin n=1 Tax=Maudiozyma saulgeensis TaxID=1789683 RepID=A0A1X7R1P6_9SACH|nr:similar to Saccharomyces cerevisiae YBR179C FZO1 Mitofusin [Kazachstania saulgeensis]